MLTLKTTLLAVLATATSLVAAAPPACLLAAVNTCPDPSDFKSICSSPDTVTSYILKNCGDNAQTALSAFEGLCKNAGQTVLISTSSSSSASDFSTASSSASSTASGASATSSAIYSASSASSSGTDISSASDSSMSSTLATSASATGSTASATDSSTAAGPTSGFAGPSATGAAPSASGTANSATGGAARLGMDIVGLLAVGFMGAVVAI
nr:hypothetical protein B0A51_06673 [Rachicladosporium sp. CCFEE 5018]